MAAPGRPPPNTPNTGEQFTVAKTLPNIIHERVGRRSNTDTWTRQHP